MTSDTFFEKDHITTLYPFSSDEQSDKTIRRNLFILDKIKEMGRITPYQLAKQTGIAYTTVCRVIREFEFCNIVKTTMTINKNNKACKLVFLPDTLTGEESALLRAKPLEKAVLDDARGGEDGNQ